MGGTYSVSEPEDIIESYNNALEFIWENYSLRQAKIDLHLQEERGSIRVKFTKENKKIIDEFNLEDRGNRITQAASYENEEQVDLMREFLKNTLVLP